MSYLTTTLSNDEWFERIYRKSQSQSSVRSAKAALKTFQSFCLEKYAKDAQAVIQDLKTNPGDRVYIFLDKFVGFMNDKHPTTIRTYFGFIRSYLRTQGVKTNLEEIKDFVNFPKPEKERRKPLTKETVRKLLDNSKEQRKALYLALLSSGMRVGEALALKKRDFDFSKDPVMISIPARYTKTKALEANIKRYPELQQLRKNIRIETEKAKKKNARLIPQWIDGKLKVAWVKNSVAKKYGYD